jgi:pilus assembly protein Flp/PilA
MAQLYARMNGFFRDEKGATAIEYGLIATLVSIAIITALGLLSDNLVVAFQTIADALVAPAAP